MTTVVVSTTAGATTGAGAGVLGAAEMVPAGGTAVTVGAARDESAAESAIASESGAGRRGAGRGEFVQIPATDHHFDRYPDARAAYRGEGGTNNADAAVGVMLRWLGEKRLRGSASRP